MTKSIVKAGIGIGFLSCIGIAKAISQVLVLVLGKLTLMGDCLEGGPGLK